jgi:hypothetical protein
MAYLAVNGNKVWEHTGDSNIMDHLMGQTVKESAYRNQYYDLTSQFHKGENTITYYHYTGDGKHGVKVRLTKGAPATTAPRPVPTTVPPTPQPTATTPPVTAKPYCTGSTCGVITSLKFNGVEIEGPPSPEILELVSKVNRYLWAVDPIYGSRRVEETFTLNIIPSGVTPVWSESRHEMLIPLDASDIFIAHEVGHYMTYGIMKANGGNPKNVPLWFREGLAEHIGSLSLGTKANTYLEFFTGNLVDKGTKAQINAAARKALADARAAQESEDLDRDTYGAAATFLEFLYDNYGKDDIIIAMVDSSEDSWQREDLDAVLERRTGKSYAALEDDWLMHLERKYDIYQNAVIVVPAPAGSKLSDTAGTTIRRVPVVGEPLGSFVSGFLQLFGI